MSYTDAYVFNVVISVCPINLGYLQLETASATINNKSSNFFNENSFTFDTTRISNNKMQEVINYIKNRVDVIKNNNSSAITNIQMSPADKIKKLISILYSITN